MKTEQLLALVALLVLNLAILVQNWRLDEQRLARARALDARLTQTRAELKRTQKMAAEAKEACENPAQRRFVAFKTGSSVELR